MKGKISSKFLLKLILFLLFVLGVGLFFKFDYFLYSDTIATVQTVENVKIDTKTGTDGSHTYEEQYYNQTITALIRNGVHKGNVITLNNECTYSNVYDTSYEKGDDIFLDNLAEERGELSANIAGSKRDYYAALVLAIFVGLFILIGGKEGGLTILSLGLNLLAFYFVMTAYNAGKNILFMTIPMVIFFTGMLLFFMYGKNEKTLLSFISTLLSVALTTVISCIVIHFSGAIDFDFMDYLNQPYDPVDATYIFISEILVGTMGAVMDVVVTVIMTVNQIVETTEKTDTKKLMKSCRAVGDDLIGTMIPVIFFTNIAASIPFFLLSMRNGIRILTILKHHVFFELARFLTGSIGIVLAIPLSAFVAIWFYQRRSAKC